MTLNQVIKRIETICLAHKQLRTFKFGQPSNFLSDRDINYAAAFLQDTGGVISTSGKATTLNYKLFFVDLVHVSEETKLNEQDVLSDMVSVAEDIIAQMSQDGYNDWRVSTDNAVQLFTEDSQDMFAGCAIDFSIRIQFTRNTCAAPSTLVIDVTDNNTDVKVYDTVYTATGSEGTSFPVTTVTGKKILHVIREGIPLYPVSNNPDTTQFTWNNTNLGVSFAPGVGERFLILYRNY